MGKAMNQKRRMKAPSKKKPGKQIGTRLPPIPPTIPIESDRYDRLKDKSETQNIIDEDACKICGEHICICFDDE